MHISDSCFIFISFGKAYTEITGARCHARSTAFIIQNTSSRVYFSSIQTLLFHKQYNVHTLLIHNVFLILTYGRPQSLVVLCKLALISLANSIKLRDSRASLINSKLSEYIITANNEPRRNCARDSSAAFSSHAWRRERSGDGTLLCVYTYTRTEVTRGISAVFFSTARYGDIMDALIFARKGKACGRCVTGECFSWNSSYVVD